MKTIEVYKTNVENKMQGNRIIGFLHRNFPWYSANFDLDDTDRVLRIESFHQKIDHENIVGVMELFGYKAEPLPD